MIFAGGVPRASYSDKISISVIQGESNHVTFDFTSKIIDFITIDRPQTATNIIATSQSGQNTVYDNPQALFVLLEEEFIAIDLLSQNWPLFKLPYLYSVHSSAIICTHYSSNIAPSFFKKLVNVDLNQNEEYSDRDWPITYPKKAIGAAEQPAHNEQKDLLLTGHEDGSICFWDVSNMSMTLIYKLKTSDYFVTDTAPPDDQEDENWPPFRKCGTFDPYSDDPKLGIQKIILCAQGETLICAGTAGQVLVMSLNDKCPPTGVHETQLRTHKINIVTDMDNFIWKGHESLQVRDTVRLVAGYQPLALLQLYPPATVSALCLNTDWKLISMGTSHGFALYDYVQHKELLVRCTLDPQLLLDGYTNGTGGFYQQHGTTMTHGAISRRKSLKKSLRESFRKLRRGRSQKTNNTKRQTMVSEIPANNTAIMRVEHLDDVSCRPFYMAKNSTFEECREGFVVQLADHRLEFRC